MENIKNKLNEARAKLTSQGWEEILSSTGDKSTGKYGILYARGTGETREQFWLNIDTISKV